MRCILGLGFRVEAVGLQGGRCEDAPFPGLMPYGTEGCSSAEEGLEFFHRTLHRLWGSGFNV